MQTVIDWLGHIAYDAAWERQKELVAERKAEPALPDRLLLLEHPPTYTVGRSGRLDNLLLSRSALAKQGIGLFQVDRGGDITYHGPGQLVGYPILNLGRFYRDQGLGYTRRYVRDLEAVIIQALAPFGIAGVRHEHHRGVWVATGFGLAKIAALGIRVSGGISSHGFALNVNPNLDHFKGIVPCGINDLGVTSMAALLHRPVTLDEVRPQLETAFGAVFDAVFDVVHTAASENKRRDALAKAPASQ